MWYNNDFYQDLGFEESHIYYCICGGVVDKTTCLIQRALVAVNALYKT